MVRRKGEAPLAPPDIETTDGVLANKCRYSLVFPYGFIDGNGMHRFWHAGQPLRDPDEIALLQARGVHLTED